MLTTHYEIEPADGTIRLIFTVPESQRETLRRIELLVLDTIRNSPDLSGMTHHTPFDTSPPPVQ